MKLTTQSIVKIIRSCRENGILHLEIPGLKLNFAQPTIAVEHVQAPTATIPRENSEEHDERIQLVEAAIEADDDESLLILEDAPEFEKRIASGDFSD